MAGYNWHEGRLDADGKEGLFGRNKRYAALDTIDHPAVPCDPVADAGVPSKRRKRARAAEDARRADEAFDAERGADLAHLPPWETGEKFETEQSAANLWHVDDSLWWLRKGIREASLEEPLVLGWHYAGSSAIGAGTTAAPVAGGIARGFGDVSSCAAFAAGWGRADPAAMGQIGGMLYGAVYPTREKARLIYERALAHLYYAGTHAVAVAAYTLVQTLAEECYSWSDSAVGTSESEQQYFNLLVWGQRAGPSASAGGSPAGDAHEEGDDTTGSGAGRPCFQCADSSPASRLSRAASGIGGGPAGRGLYLSHIAAICEASGARLENGTGCIVWRQYLRSTLCGPGSGWALYAHLASASALGHEKARECALRHRGCVAALNYAYECSRARDFEEAQAQERAAEVAAAGDEQDCNEYHDEELEEGYDEEENEDEEYGRYGSSRRRAKGRRRGGNAHGRDSKRRRRASSGSAHISSGDQEGGIDAASRFALVDVEAGVASPFVTTEAAAESSSSSSLCVSLTSTLLAALRALTSKGLYETSAPAPPPTWEASAAAGTLLAVAAALPNSFGMSPVSLSASPFPARFDSPGKAVDWGAGECVDAEVVHPFHCVRAAVAWAASGLPLLAACGLSVAGPDAWAPLQPVGYAASPLDGLLSLAGFQLSSGEGARAGPSGAKTSLCRTPTGQLQDASTAFSTLQLPIPEHSDLALHNGAERAKTLQEWARSFIADLSDACAVLPARLLLAVPWTSVGCTCCNDAEADRGDATPGVRDDDMATVEEERSMLDASRVGLALAAELAGLQAGFWLCRHVNHAAMLTRCGTFTNEALRRIANVSEPHLKGAHDRAPRSRDEEASNRAFSHWPAMQECTGLLTALTLRPADLGCAAVGSITRSGATGAAAAICTALHRHLLRDTSALSLFGIMGKKKQDDSAPGERHGDGKEEEGEGICDYFSLPPAPPLAGMVASKSTKEDCILLPIGWDAMVAMAALSGLIDPASGEVDPAQQAHAVCSRNNAVRVPSETSLVCVDAVAAFEAAPLTYGWARLRAPIHESLDVDLGGGPSRKSQLRLGVPLGPVVTRAGRIRLGRSGRVRGGQCAVAAHSSRASMPHHDETEMGLSVHSVPTISPSAKWFTLSDLLSHGSIRLTCQFCAGATCVLPFNVPVPNDGDGVSAGAVGAAVGSTSSSRVLRMTGDMDSNNFITCESPQCRSIILWCCNGPAGAVPSHTDKATNSCSVGSKCEGINRMPKEKNKRGKYGAMRCGLCGSTPFEVMAWYGGVEGGEVEGAAAHSAESGSAAGQGDIVDVEAMEFCDDEVEIIDMPAVSRMHVPQSSTSAGVGHNGTQSASSSNVVFVDFGAIQTNGVKSTSKDNEVIDDEAMARLLDEELNGHNQGQASSSASGSASHGVSQATRAPFSDPEYDATTCGVCRLIPEGIDATLLECGREGCGLAFHADCVKNVPGWKPPSGARWRCNVCENGTTVAVRSFAKDVAHVVGAAWGASCRDEIAVKCIETLFGRRQSEKDAALARNLCEGGPTAVPEAAPSDAPQLHVPYSGASGRGPPAPPPPLMYRAPQPLVAASVGRLPGSSQGRGVTPPPLDKGKATPAPPPTGSSTSTGGRTSTGSLPRFIVGGW